jgi:hypothetical protein
LPEREDKTDYLYYEYLKYEPQESFIEVPNRVFGGKKSKRMTVLKRGKSELVQEFTDTLSTVNNKPIKDETYAYFVLEFHSAPLSKKYFRLMDEMKVHVVTFLDKSQKTALVESRYDVDLKKVSNEVRDIVKKVRPLEASEKIEPSLLNTIVDENVIINTIPNVPIDKITSHLTKISRYITRYQGEFYTSLLDKENKRGSVVVKTNGEVLEKLANESSIILSAYKVPDLIISIIRKRKRKKNRQSELTLSSIEPHSHNLNTYDIIEIDSGTKILKEFQSRVVSKPALPSFLDGDDKDNHGTPIAGLLLFGEDGNNTSSPFIVHSYKAYEGGNGGENQGTLYQAVTNVTKDYKGDSKIFTSSINFTGINDFTEYETIKLDRLVQSQNICFVNSAGNIEDAMDRLNSGVSHTAIWEREKVLHPSDGPSIISVGGYCKPNFLKTAPCCFSRHGSDFLPNKPEVLEYGGTLKVDGGTTDEGISTIGITGRIKRFGTSFSAPIFARTLAFIARATKNDFSNSETIKAVALGSCKTTSDFDLYCVFGKVNIIDIFGINNVKTSIIFEGTFKNMTNDRLPIHEINLYIPAQPVTVTMTLVHSDNYNLATKIDNYTAITVEGTKGQQKLREGKGLKIRGWSHVRREVYSYKANSIGTWRFRLKPRLNKIPLSEIPTLELRYGGIINVVAKRVPTGYNSLKQAIEMEAERMKIAAGSLR